MTLYEVICSDVVGFFGRVGVGGENGWPGLFTLGTADAASPARPKSQAQAHPASSSGAPRNFQVNLQDTESDRNWTRTRKPGFWKVQQSPAIQETAGLEAICDSGNPVQETGSRS